MPPLEIIDLTVPAPAPSEPTTQDSNDNPVETPATPGAKRERKRRRKNSAPATPTATSSKSRETSNEREKDGESRRAKRKKKQSSKDGEPNPVKDLTAEDGELPEADGPESPNLFYVDVNPVVIPATRYEDHSPKKDESSSSDKLLLPSHVAILGSTPFEIIAPPTPSDSEDEDFIKYLDYDDATDVVRYFHEAPDEAAQIERTVCKNCGVEGQHKTRECPVMICLTCGARDEHSTRSCPISKTCFNCGMKGHINIDCPNRGSGKASRFNREYECERCSAPTHQTNECPTWWRLYEYVSVGEQSRILAHRQSKKDLQLGEGGEGFVADDEWCYHCGDCGHLGDDCDSPPYSIHAEEHSAFGKANVMAGPFYDPNAPKASSSRSLVRDWAKLDKLTEINIDGVGKQGRLKAKAAMQKKQSRQDDREEGPDDWFDKASRDSRPKSSNRDNRAPPTGPAAQSKKISFGKSIGSQFKPASLPERPSVPSLLDRMSLGDGGRESRSNRRPERRDYHRQDEPSRSHRDRDKDRDRDRPRRRDDDRPSRHHNKPAEVGPRYSGGYSRRP